MKKKRRKERKVEKREKEKREREIGGEVFATCVSVLMESGI